MNTSKPTEKPLGWGKSILWLVVGVVCFHLAYTSLKWSAAGLFIFGYALALVRLTDQPTVRRAFYFGLTAGFFCAAPQLFFFWKVFNAAAIVLWLVFAFWIGLFAAIVCGSIRRWGKVKGLWLVPVVWTGIEYFRSELYYLKFSWLIAGDVFPNYLIPPFLKYGVYGIGFLIFATAIVVFSKAVIRQRITWFLMVLFFLSVFAYFLGFIAAARYETPKPPLSIVGIQLEFPPAGIIPNALNNALKKHPDAQIAKPRWNDELISAPGQRAGHIDALIKAAFSAVDDQHLLALTQHGVFQRAERRLYRLAITDETGACGCQVMRKDCIDDDGGNDEDCENDHNDFAMTL